MNFSDFNLSKNSDGLLTVVVQDEATLKVLMVAYMNREAFEKTVKMDLIKRWELRKINV